MNLDSINLEKLTDEEFKILERRIEDERKRRDKEIHDKKQKIGKNYSSIFTKLYIYSMIKKYLLLIVIYLL
jgi:hypothetical protein